MMKNNDVASLLLTIADLLDIKGENFFKTRAYRMAAQTITDLSEDIEQIVAEQRLEEIPGVGSALAKKIEEYVSTGELQFLKKLEQQIPLSILNLLEIPSLGPKKVSTMYHKLHITTIPELKKACLNHQVQQLDGFGELSEINILRGIALLEKTEGRVLLHNAINVGEKYISFLDISSYIQQISIAGSLRRKKDSIGDIDILVASNKPEEIMNHVVKYQDIKRILMKGNTKTSVLLSNDLQVDVRVVNEDSFGSALQYFTGSKEHNVAMRSLALKNGFKLNEYGLFKKETDEKIAGKNEDSIYKMLNLPFIPPELRENRGEIEQGLLDNLPNLIHLSDIKGDLHIHSSYSDGHDSIESIANKAEQLGYEYIGITDHSESLHVAHGLNKEQIMKKSEEIKKLNKKSKMKIFLGTECDITPDGGLDYDDEVLGLFDYVGIGIHSKFKMTEKEATNRITNAMAHPSVTFLAHPTCRLFGNREPLPLDIEKIFETAVETNTFLEINSFPDRLDLSDVHCKRAKERGVTFCIGTDSHAIDHLSFMKYGIFTARRGWLVKKDVFNTQSLEAVTAYFKK